MWNFSFLIIHSKTILEMAACFTQTFMQWQRFEETTSLWFSTYFLWVSQSLEEAL